MVVSLETNLFHKMATRNVDPDFSKLPEIPLVNILSCLNLEDLSMCCLVCSRFNQVANGLSLWKKWCREVWVVYECPEGKSWKRLYFERDKDWGRYKSCYADIRKAWNIIEDFTREKCPEIYASLKPGIAEDELRRAEERKLEGVFSVIVIADASPVAIVFCALNPLFQAACTSMLFH